MLKSLHHRALRSHLASGLAAIAGLLALGASDARAQVAGYSFSQSTAAYVPITGGTVLGNATSDAEQFNNPTVPLGTIASTSGPGLSIGFTFQYAGVPCDQMAINNNGWLALGSSRSGATAVSASFSTGNLNPISNATALPTPLAAAFVTDLAAQTGATLRYELVGTAPARTLVVQWANYRFASVTGNSLNFQIRLNEADNSVAFAYGPTTLTNTTPSGVQVGLRGTLNTDFAARTSSPVNASSWTNSTAAANTATMPASTTVFPPVGLTYTFTPPACFPPRALAVGSVTASSASLTFTPGNGVASYLVTVTPQGGAPVTVAAAATASPVALPNLMPSTNYTVTLVPSCGGGATTTAVSTTFITTGTNDDCATATPLAVGVNTCNNVVVNTIGATASGTAAPTPACGTPAGPDVWYTVVVPANGGLVLATNALAGSTVTNTVLEAYAGNCGSLTSVGCNDDLNNGLNNLFSTLVLRNQPPGATLYVRARVSGATATGTFNLCATTLRDNDDPAGAQPLPVGTTCTPVAGLTVGASLTTPSGYVNPGNCGVASNPLDVWYSFRTNASGAGSSSVRIQVSGTPAGLVRVFSAASSAGPFVQVGCAQGAANNQQAAPLRLTTLTPNTQYYVSVSGYGSGDFTGPFTICVDDLSTAATRTGLASALSLYPNPARQRFTLVLPALGAARTATVELFNNVGQTVRTQALVLAAAGTEAQVSLAGVPAGLYTVRVRAGAETATVRLVVE